MKKGPTTSLYFVLLLVPLFWGGAFVAAEHVLTELPALTAAALRFGGTGMILLVMVLVKEKINFKLIKKHWLLLLLMALSGIYGYNAFFFLGLTYTSAVNGSLIFATTPVLATLGAVLFLKEKSSKKLIIGLVLSLTGVIIVITEGSITALFQLNFNYGDLFIILSALCWAAYSIFGKMVMDHFSVLMTTMITTLIGTVFLFIHSFTEKSWDKVLTLSVQSWGEMLFLIVCSSVIAFSLWNTGVQRLGASRASIYMNLVPIFTALLAVFVYGSAITLFQIIGILIVFLGVYFVTYEPEKRKSQCKGVGKWKRV